MISCVARVAKPCCASVGSKGLASSYLFVIVQYDKVVKPRRRIAGRKANEGLSMKNAVIRALSAVAIGVSLYTFSSPLRERMTGVAKFSFVFLIQAAQHGTPSAAPDRTAVVALSERTVFPYLQRRRFHGNETTV